MPAVAMKHETDPRDDLLAKIGDISRFQIQNNELLAVTYLRPEKTMGGIILTARNLQEDLYQSKAHLVVAIGPGCEFFGAPIKLHDWIVIRPSDAWALEVNGVHCRLVIDKYVRAKIQDPTTIW